MPDLPAHACPRTRAAATLRSGATLTECHGDADCTQGRNGRCVEIGDHESYGPTVEGTTCSYDECFVDADCGARGECWCATDPRHGSICLRGECDTDVDCGVGRYCRRGRAGKYCRSRLDQCVEETACGQDRSCRKNPATGLYECLRIEPLRR